MAAILCMQMLEHVRLNDITCIAHAALYLLGLSTFWTCARVRSLDDYKKLKHKHDKKDKSCT